jgi:hypothetical protein
MPQTWPVASRAVHAATPERLGNQHYSQTCGHQAERLTSLQSLYLSWCWGLVGRHIFCLWCEQKLIVPILGLDPRCDSFEDLGRDWRFEIRLVVLADELLDLGRREDPADIVEDFNVRQRSL